MTKGIGWDIGIKNLAFCILDSHTSKVANSQKINENTFIFNNNKYDITHWSDISLVTQIESNLQTSGEVSHINNNMHCCAIKNSAKKKSKDESSDESKVCGKKAFYSKEEVLPNGSYEGLCKTHFKKLNIPRLPELNVKKCWEKYCTSKPVQVIKSHIYKGYCKKHINEKIKSGVHTDADYLKINHAKTTAKIDINQLGIALFQELNKIKEHIVTPSIILLENQPVLKNPTMKSMQMFLYSYYLMKIMDGDNLSNKKLQCYCASKKLDMIKFLPETEQLRINTFIDTVKNPYQKNKKMSIMMVEVLLQKNAKWSAFFKSHNKQDDLADSLLMTLHYFEKGNLLKLKNDNKKEEAKNAKLIIESTIESTVDSITGANDEDTLDEDIDSNSADNDASNNIIIRDLDVESNAILEEVKLKKRNRLIVNAKFKKLR